MKNRNNVKKIVELCDKFVSVLRMICVVMAAIFISLMIIQVILRYTFNAPIYGLDELVIAISVWYLAIGVVVVLWENAHALIEFLLKHFLEKFRGVVEIAEHIIILISSILFIFSGQILFAIQVKTNPVGGLPFARAYYNALPIIVMGVLLIIVGLVRFIQYLFDREEYEAREKTGGLIDG
ncbi:MAG: TRAP transporter small permease subunit [Clostridiaceae bacterium]|jgi:TRAP-type C4-dicarboxylate transport system permease small subunit|nr:TRAP transporter small permease subunit [Clostridiaceae bacterium]